MDALWRAALRFAYQLRLAWWFVRRPVVVGAYIAVWHGDRVLLIQNSYRRRLSFPAGGLKGRETSRDAAVRELREEVGIGAEAADLAYYGEIVHSSSYAEDHAHVYELRCATPPPIRVDGREVVWADFVAPGDALARDVVGTVRRYLERITRSAPPRPPPRTRLPRASSADRP